MDLIRETSHYATQFEMNTLEIQSERQLIFANIWLNFVRKKRSFTTVWKNSTTLPMWLLPGIHFLRHICSLNFTNSINDDLFSKFYENMQRTIDYLHSPTNKYEQKSMNSNQRPKKSLSSSSTTKHGYEIQKKRNFQLTRIQQLDLMDKKIDRQRIKNGLIGKIKEFGEHSNKMPTISKRMEQDLAFLKIRNFHKLNLLSRGQYATSKHHSF